MKSLLQLSGIGLRPPHYEQLLETLPPLAWLEVHSENYFGEGGKSLSMLEKVRTHYPISLHGVGLSIGSADELNWNHLKQLRDLMMRIKPCLVSDHLAWSSFQGQYVHDLLPLPYTEESLQHIVSRIQQVQEYLNQQILVENISNYMQFAESSLSEADFLVEVAKQSGCGILLDINNIYVSCTNLDTDANDYLAQIPENLVQEIHVGGFTTEVIGNKEILIDSHNRPIVPAVWALYKQAIEQFGRKPTIVEWDTHLPPLETLCLEAFRAEKIMREIYATAKCAS